MDLIQSQMEASGSYEALVSYYITTKCLNPEDYDMNWDCGFKS